MIPKIANYVRSSSVQDYIQMRKFVKLLDGISDSDLEKYTNSKRNISGVRAMIEEKIMFMPVSMYQKAKELMKTDFDSFMDILRNVTV